MPLRVEDDPKMKFNTARILAVVLAFFAIPGLGFAAGSQLLVGNPPRASTAAHAGARRVGCPPAQLARAGANRSRLAFHRPWPQRVPDPARVGLSERGRAPTHGRVRSRGPHPPMDRKHGGSATGKVSGPP